VLPGMGDAFALGTELTTGDVRLLPATLDAQLERRLMRDAHLAEAIVNTVIATRLRLLDAAPVARLTQLDRRGRN
jgi:hypothetical protein